MKVYILPKFKKDTEQGGIPRVVAAQHRYLPDYGIELVDDAQASDVIALHASHWQEPTLSQKVVSHCHGLYWTNYQWPRWAHIVNRDVAECIRKADVVTAPSEWVANAIRRSTNLPVTVIGHGVNLEEWQVPDRSNNYILWNKTRPDPVCDPRVVNILANKLPNVRFATTFGDEADNVSVIGMLDYENHKPYIQNAMLYLCTARETFGIGTLEALACGVPIVGWDWGGQHDIVTPEVGRLVPLGDYDALVQAVRYCIENRTAMSYSARKLVEDKYQWKDVIKEYASLYGSLTESRTTKRVSVIIPSYNLKDTLPAAVNSVVGQLDENDELIIVDDCSTDGSYETACNLVRDSNNCTVIRTPSNLYLAGALNYGIQNARGKYILPLDADNAIERNTLSTLAGELDRTRELDIVYGKVKFLNPDGTPYRSQITDPDGVSRWPPDVFNYTQQLSHRNQIPSTSMYRRTVWERIGGYRKRCRTAEDADFWCRATTYGARAHKVTDAVTLVYTVREDSMSHVERDWPWEQWYENVSSFMAPTEGNIQVEVPEPIISIIIPVGPGHGDWVTDALDSLSNQTMKDWECIVVDDTHDIRWLPSWVRHYYTPVRASGTSVARNIGIREARGQLFLLLDADDYLESEALQEMYQAYRMYGGYIYSDFYKPDDMTHVQIEGDCQTLKHNLIHPITCLFPSEVKSLVKFDEDLKYGEDWDYILSVVDAGWCGTHIRKPLLYYRQKYGNNRNNLKENIEQIRELMQERHMASCGCGRGGGQPIAQSAMQQQMAMSNDLVLLEFTRSDTGTITYRGPNTGSEYRFGNNEGHKLGYVHSADLEWFLQRSEFKLADMAVVG